MTKSINNTYNRSIKATPNDAKYKMSDFQIFENLYPRKINKKKRKKSAIEARFNVGDVVRIALNTGKFTRSRDPTFSTEKFTVIERAYVQGIPIYRIKDALNNEIQGTFYQDELTASLDEDEEDRKYTIEKILGRKKIRGKNMVLVKWLGMSKDFNSYIPADEITEIK